MLKNWQTRIGDKLRPDQWAAYERWETLEQEALKVFGNEDDAGQWGLRQTEVEGWTFKQPAGRRRGRTRRAAESASATRGYRPRRPPEFPPRNAFV